MAYVNVADWSVDQVGEWIKGLESCLHPYVGGISSSGIDGKRLMLLTASDLEDFGVLKVGHQEILGAAINRLREFHHNLDRENLQLLAMQMSCKASGLKSSLTNHSSSHVDPNNPDYVSADTLSDVYSILLSVKAILAWLGRYPFEGNLCFQTIYATLLQLGLQLATCSQRDRFADHPLEEIIGLCSKLQDAGNQILTGMNDPLILQPASLDVATIKRRIDEELGLHLLMATWGGILVAAVKFQSPSHQCGKLRTGDELVQINYQTVVGWTLNHALQLLAEGSGIGGVPSELLLTIKRRPQHAAGYGQIYIRPYRLPSKRRPSGTYSRWENGFANSAISKSVLQNQAKALPSPILEKEVVETLADFEMALTSDTYLPFRRRSSEDITSSSGLYSSKRKPVVPPIVIDMAPSVSDEEGEVPRKSSALTVSGFADNVSVSSEDEAFFSNVETDADAELEESFSAALSGGSPISARIFLPKPRPAVNLQRRATITGASPTSTRPPVDLDQLWQAMSHSQRRKSVSRLQYMADKIRKEERLASRGDSLDQLLRFSWDLNLGPAATPEQKRKQYKTQESCPALLNRAKQTLTREKREGVVPQPTKSPVTKLQSTPVYADDETERRASTIAESPLFDLCAGGAFFKEDNSAESSPKQSQNLAREEPKLHDSNQYKDIDLPSQVPSNSQTPHVPSESKFTPPLAVPRHLAEKTELLSASTESSSAPEPDCKIKTPIEEKTDNLPGKASSKGFRPATLPKPRSKQPPVPPPKPMVAPTPRPRSLSLSTSQLAPPKPPVKTFQSLPPVPPRRKSWANPGMSSSSSSLSSTGVAPKTKASSPVKPKVAFGTIPGSKSSRKSYSAGGEVLKSAPSYTPIAFKPAQKSNYADGSQEQNWISTFRSTTGEGKKATAGSNPPTDNDSQQYRMSAAFVMNLDSPTNISQTKVAPAVPEKSAQSKIAPPVPEKHSSSVRDQDNKPTETHFCTNQTKPVSPSAKSKTFGSNILQTIFQKHPKEGKPCSFWKFSSLNMKSRYTQSVSDSQAKVGLKPKPVPPAKVFFARKSEGSLFTSHKPPVSSANLGGLHGRRLSDQVADSRGRGTSTSAQSSPVRSDAPKTPRRPAMGIAMIRKQSSSAEKGPMRSLPPTPTYSPNSPVFNFPHSPKPKAPDPESPSRQAQDYPGLEYPPMFEPATYSLRSLTKAHVPRKGSASVCEDRKPSASGPESLEYIDADIVTSGLHRNGST